MNQTIQSTENSIFDQEITWAQNSFHLDRRLVKAILRIGYIYPTLIQSKCIPIALEGKDILVQARTGSGKTVAYALPLLQKLLQLKQNTTNNNPNHSIKAIILAPTKELIHQTEKVMNDLTYYCKDSLSFYAINDEKQEKINLHLACHPDILIATPAKLAKQLSKLNLTSVGIVIVDEADIIFSYGYKDDIDHIFHTIPKIFQGFLLSATMPNQLKKFKEIFLHNPVILTLKEPKGKGHILQFHIETTENDKYLILYVFLKLGLLQGKGLIFVNDVNKCYRLKLFLQQFYIPTAVLNAEIPLNSRHHILEEYNRGIFNYLIASDAIVDLGEEGNDEDEDDSEGENEQKTRSTKDTAKKDAKIDENNEDSEEDDEEDEEEDDDDVKNEDKNDDEEDDEEAEQASEENEEEEQAKPKKEAKKKQRQGKFVEKDDFGVSRGIDFQGVNFVVNFDFPKTSSAYIHRIGRTARGIKSGTSLSFVTKYNEVRPESFLDNKVSVRDHAVLQQVRQRQPRLDAIDGDNVFAAMGVIDHSSNQTNSHQDENRLQPTPLVFNTQELEPFRYRVEDVLRNVTTSAVRELRMAEIRREILNSEKLKTYFAENPNDLKVLRHDKASLHPIKQREHLKYIPDYLIPDSMKAVSTVQMTSKNFRKNQKRKFANHHSNETEESRKKKSKKDDPLYTSKTISVKTTSNEGREEEEGGSGNNQSSSQEFLFNTAPAGRKEWKMKHRKGEFNPKLQQQKAYQTPGTYQKPKKKLERISRQ